MGPAAITTAETLADATDRLRAAGIDDARLEAEVLLAHAARVDRAHVIAGLQEPLPDAVRAVYDALLARRLRREPLAYIVGHREFYGMQVACDARALIPRPETELLVDLALREIQSRPAALRIVDVGTGSGAIACAIARNAPTAAICATDASGVALDLAHENVRTLGIAGGVRLHKGDLLDGLGVFDVIVANLPYVSEAEFARAQPEVRQFEPRAALVPGPLGTEANERLLAEARAHLAAPGVLALEFGETQAAVLVARARQHFPGALVSVMKDLAGRERVLVVRRPE